MEVVNVVVLFGNESRVVFTIAGLRFCSPTFLLIILLINVTVSVRVLPSSAYVMTMYSAVRIPLVSKCAI